MRKMLIGVFTLVSAVAGVAACGSNDKGKASSKAPVAQTAVDLAQKAAVQTLATNETAGMAGTQPDPLGGETKGVRATLVLSEGKSGFRFNSKALTEEAKAKIDEMFTGGKVDLKDAHFEIEGYTDNLGSKEVNEQFGRARAEAVRLYLSEQYEIPMDCIKVVSFGLENPVADNGTPEGRAMNRRVVIKVLD